MGSSLSSLQFIVQLRKCSVSGGDGEDVGWKKGFSLLNVQSYEYFRRKTLKPFLLFPAPRRAEKKTFQFSLIYVLPEGS